jgi:hypothetical protein
MVHCLTLSCAALILIIGMLLSPISTANPIVKQSLTPQQTLYIDAQAAIAQGNQQKYWAFQTWYTQTPVHWLNAQLQCRYLDNITRSGQFTAALDKQVNALWQHPRSQDKACDQVFQRWQKQGGITTERILQRIKRVAKEGSPRLIVYLTRLLPPELQPIGRMSKR